MYRKNVGDNPPRKSFLKRILKTLEWLEFRNSGVLFREDIWPDRPDPYPNLPRAELSEEERNQALDEIRRRPRIG